MSKIAEHPKLAVGFIALLLGTSATGFGLTGITVVNDQTNYSELLGQYNQVLTQYGTLDSTYNGLNTTYNELLGQYSGLLSQYNGLVTTYELLSGDYDTLNETYWQLVEDYNQLHDDYEQLQNNYAQLQSNYDQLQNDHSQLQTSYIQLQASYDILQALYTQLLADHLTLQTQFDDLQTQFNDLQVQFNSLNTMWNMYISLFANASFKYKLPIWYEAVRRGEFVNRPFSWQSYVNFMAKMVLHDTDQCNYFSYYGELYKYFLTDTSGNPNNDTGWIAYYNMENVLADEVWNKWIMEIDPPPDNLLQNIRPVHNWVMTLLDYEYDDHFMGTTYPADYPKFPLETALRTMGDCEDQAMLDAACLESSGEYLASYGFQRYETVMGVVHDSAHPEYGVLNHAFLWVRLGNTQTDAVATLNSWGVSTWTLWMMPDSGSSDYVWCVFDPTWDTVAGARPQWLQEYYDHQGNLNQLIANMNYAIVSQSWLGTGSGTGDMFEASCISISS